ncbi:hypothetical protein N825_09390 [Skermanella stibiiresistens SB22]|uniref:Uncharacterized protein n=1 Tax=Skermanella stibiiresistens SB22 TaxID=1385369 RepID=W9GVG0_9PROT|nr:polysaccharide biosynthesis C-terminal domain-containing protein [Skermanella stibiiresistens]EWY37784.1 hypothetical protein N825_09390 [Skermanella stibiiresistens SB22]
MKALRFIFGGGSVAAAIQTFGARVIILGMNLLTGIVTANLLGPEGRGAQGAMALWPAVLMPILAIGLPMSLTYNWRKSERFGPEFFYAAIAVSVVVGTVGGGAAALLMPWLLEAYDPGVIAGAQGLVLMMPLMLCNTLVYSVYEALGRFRWINIVMMGQTLATLLLLMALGYMGELTAVRSAYCYALPPLVFALVSGLRLLPQMPMRLTRLKATFRRLHGYGWRSYGIEFLGVISAYIDQLLLVGLLAPAELGVYVVAASLAKMLHMISGSAAVVLFPKVAAQPLEDVIAYVSLSSRVATTATGLVALAIAVAAPVMLPFIYGEEFRPAIHIFPILLAEAVLTGSIRIIGQGFMGAGRPGVIAWAQGVGLVCVVPLLWVLVPTYGVLGAAMSMLLATMIRLGFIAASYEYLLRRRMPGLLIRRSDVSFLYRRFVA